MPPLAPNSRAAQPPKPSSRARAWIHQPGVTFLNHGSFGGCPAAVLETQAAWRARLEGEPVRFFVEDLFDLFDWVREDTARFLGCDREGLVFVPNATSGVATAVHNLIASGQAQAGDQVLVTDHEYPACVNNVRHMARIAGIEVVTARLPFPDPTPQAVIDAVMSVITPKTRLALLSQITSTSAMVLPAHDLVRQLESRGVRVVLDGAHAPGHVAMRVEDFGASYYTANMHKWACSPKGSAVLWVHPEQRDRCRPMVLSNMAEKPMPGRPHLHTEFDYIGTNDSTAVLCIPAALRILADIVSGRSVRRFTAEAFDTQRDAASLGHAWARIRSENRQKALEAQRMLGMMMGTRAPVPPGMTACIALVALPAAPPDLWERLIARPTPYADALQDRLIANWGIQVPVVHATTPSGSGVRCVRVSGQLYNSLDQYQYLGQALLEELSLERRQAGKSSYTALDRVPSS